MGFELKWELLHLCVVFFFFFLIMVAVTCVVILAVNGRNTPVFRHGFPFSYIAIIMQFKFADEDL